MTKELLILRRCRQNSHLFYYSPAHIVECVLEYTFLIKKVKTKQKKTRRQKAKETIEKVSVENLTGYYDVILIEG